MSASVVLGHQHTSLKPRKRGRNPAPSNRGAHGVHPLTPWLPGHPLSRSLSELGWGLGAQAGPCDEIPAWGVDRAVGTQQSRLYFRFVRWALVSYWHLLRAGGAACLPYPQLECYVWVPLDGKDFLQNFLTGSLSACFSKDARGSRGPGFWRFSQKIFSREQVSGCGYRPTIRCVEPPWG